MTDQRRHGMCYEDQARRYLEARGLGFLQQNYHCRFGEIDLIMRDSQTLCFVEVKYRRSLSFGGAAYAIPPAKQRKLIKSALYFLSCHQQLAGMNPRFDALLIQGQANASDEINWIRGAFDSP